MFHGTLYIVRPLWLQCAYEGLWERDLRVNAVGMAAVWGREGVHCGAGSVLCMHVLECGEGDVGVWLRCRVVYTRKVVCV